MIKSYYHITIADFDLMERTGAISQFKTWYNPLPSVLFAKRIKKELEVLIKMVGDGRNSELENEIRCQELKYLAKLQIEVTSLGIIQNLIFVHLELLTRILAMKNQINSRKLRKIINRDEDLRKIFDEVKNYTGIDIKEMKDIESFKSVVQHRTDKLTEFINKQNAKNQNEPTKKEYLMDIVQSIMMYLQMSPVGAESMRVIHFMSLYKKGVDKWKAEKEMIEKNKQ